jgi:hypothetical protein
MEVLIAVACGALGILLLSVVLVLPLRIRFVRELRRKSRQDLERSVFRYENEYFSYIGAEHPEVERFRALTEQKDLQGIRRDWNKLSRLFVTLERKAGHRGRPLIMDYYNWYELELRELNRRGI